MKTLNKIALVLGWLTIIGLVIGGAYFILASALSMIYLLLPIAIVVLIVVLIVKKK